jgi:PKD repeat protein
MEKTLTYFKTRFRLLSGSLALAMLGIFALSNSAHAQYTEPGHYYGCEWTNGTGTQYPRYASIEDISIVDGSGNVVFSKAGDECNAPNTQLNQANGHYNLVASTSAFTLSAGATYTFNIECSNAINSTIRASVGVWFDFNGDEDFADNGEFVSQPNWVIPVGSQQSFTFTVPCAGTSGPMRLRVRSDYQPYTWNAGRHSASGINQRVYYGETEDYACTYSVPAGLSSNFFAPDTVFVNTITQFVNSNKSGYIGHEWTVDGRTYSTTDAEHIFTSTGTYSVKLKSTNCNGSDSTTKTVVVVSPTAPPVADFVSTKNVLEIFDNFELIDLSTNGASNWDWFVHNGIDTISVAQGGDPYTHRNPVVFTGTNPAGIPKIFPDEGKWTVCLKSSNSIGSSATVCKTDYIEVRRTSFSIGPETSLPANIITATRGTLYDKGGPNNNYPSNDANLEALIAPCGAQSVTLNFNMFKVLSNGNLKVYDGTNALGTPLHSGNGFTQGNAPSGPLTANSGAMYLLWNSGAGGTDSGFAATWTSVAGSGAAPVADFELPADTIYNAVFENFINTSTDAEGSTTFEWSINGSPVGNTRDLENRIFLVNGNYSITLRVIGCDGSVSTKTKNFFVANPNTPTELDFMADNRRPAVGDDVTFTAMSDKANRWEWSFFPPTGVTATGVVSDALSERTFQFTQPGVYAVQLKGYNYNASPDSSVSENTITKTQYVVVVEHCVPVISVTTSSDIGISKATLTDIASGDVYETESETGVAYEDFTDLGIIELNFGGEYNIELERSSNINPMNRAVWIDWNVDGDFDASELVASEDAANTMMWDSTFRVPDASTAFEATTRMRIGVSYGTDLNAPCGANSNPAANRIGEFEDYAVRVVNDGDDPVITLNGNDTIYIEQATTPNYVSPSATVTDPSQGDITDNLVVTTDVDQTLAGVYYEVYNAMDASGNEAMPVTRVVYVVLDQTPPVLTLNGASDITLEVGSPYNELGATATDAKEGNLDGAIVVSGSVDVNTLGTYEITYFVQDNQGNSTTAIRTINVVDTEAPVIENVNADKTNPAAWTVEVQLRSIFVDVTSATDNYNSFGNNLTMSISPESPQGGASVDTRFQGTTSVTYVATDESGNQTTQVINYVVRDYVPPVIDLRTLDVIEHEVNNPYTPVAPTASDNLYDNTQISLTQSSNVNPYVLGTYQDTYTATDASGNVATKIRTVHVVDNEAPSVSGKQGGVLRVGVGSQFNAIDFILFSDNYDSPADLIANHTVSFNDINVWEPGLYSAVFETADNSGNNSESFTLYVEVSHDYFRLTNGIEDLTLENILNVSPNPTSGVFNINVNLPENEDIALNVYNAYGQKVMEVANGNIQKGAYTVDISNNATGIYYVQMNIEGTILTKKVVLNR